MKRRVFEGLFGLSLAALALQPSAGWAQADGARPEAAVHDYAIPAGPLAVALNSFADTSRLRLLYDAAITRGLDTGGLNGRFAVNDALARLLAGSGLTYRYVGAGSVTLERLPATQGGGADLLPPVTLGAAAGETAYSPVAGYVATRSATASKSDIPLIETPMSVSVITRDQMDAQNAQNLHQSLRYSVGAPDTRAAFGGYDIMYNRGFILDRYLDGMKLQGSTGFVVPQMELYGVERVEVLRGPASILYGQASPGGLANMISKRPTEEPLREIQVGLGNYNTYNAGFDLSGPADKDKRFLYRITGFGQDGESHVNYVENQRLYIAPSLTWRPDASTSLTLLTHYRRDPDLGLYNLVPAAGSLTHNPVGKIPTGFYTGEPGYNRIDRTQYGLGYALDHRFNNAWAVRQNLRYLDTKGNLDQVLPFGLAADNRTLNRYVQQTHETLGAFSVDNQLEGKLSTGPVQHILLVGLDYQRTSYEQTLNQGFTTPIDIFNPVYGAPVAAPSLIRSQTDQTLWQAGIYAQDHIRYGRWVLQAGLRQDWAKQDSTNVLSGASTSQRDTATTWRAGLVHLFDNGLAPYASYSTSFQPTTGNLAGGGTPEPTRGKQYEVGVKYQPRGINASLMVSAFHLTQENVLTALPGGGGFNQIGEVRSRGIELEARATLTEGLSLTAAYTYLESEITDGTAATRGKTPPYIPEQVASLWADYTFQRGPAAGFGFGAGMRYVAETFGNDTNTVSVPSNTLFDATVHYELGGLTPQLEGWKATITANNLFDREYISECTNANCLYGLRRTVLGTLRYRW